MAWQTPPVFTDGIILSANDLNILTSNMNLLHEALSGVAPSFTQTDLSAGNVLVVYNQLHRAQYFHIKVSITSGTHDELYVRYNGTTIYSDLGSRTGPYTWQPAAVDLNTNPGGLTLGNFYDVQVEFNWNGTPGNGYVEFLGEVGSTTAPL